MSQNNTEWLPKLTSVSKVLSVLKYAGNPAQIDWDNQFRAFNCFMCAFEFIARLVLPALEALIFTSSAIRTLRVVSVVIMPPVRTSYAQVFLLAI